MNYCVYLYTRVCYYSSVYDIEPRFMVNWSVNEFYTRFLFKVDALPQDVIFSLVIYATFFNNLSPDVREFLIILRSPGSPKVSNWNQSLEKPEAPFGQICGSGIRNEYHNYKSGGASSNRKLLS